MLAAKKTLTPADVDAYIADTAATRDVPVESLKGYRDMMLGTIASRSAADMTSWNQKQVYIALGTMLTAAAEAKIDAVPMEGFNPAQVDAILGLESQGLTATVLVPVGHRAADDSYATLKKVRFSQSSVIEHV